MEPITSTPGADPAAPELKILRTQVYRGPNVWSYVPSVHLTVDLGVLEHWPSNTLPGFTESILTWLPGLREHSCSRGKTGGFVERLEEGTWMGHVAEHIALQLQRETGAETRRGKTRSVKGRPGVYNVVYAMGDERVARAAGELAVSLVNEAVRRSQGMAPELDVAGGIEELLLLARRFAFGPSTQAILDEAANRDIPFMRLSSGSLVQLGQGVHARRIRATMTSQTSSLAVDIAGDKVLTSTLLAAAGLPVPRSEGVRTKRGAVQVANEIGFPVVVKPLDGNHGRGVILNLRTDAEVEDAFDKALDESRGGVVVVESYVTGKDYRVLVVGGKMVALAERVPAHVIGDGTHTIAELVETTNADPRRGVGHEKVLTRISVDDNALEVLQGQGYDIGDVPEPGVMVKLALTGNMSTGGISIDRTEEAHPDNVEIAEEAARVVGLDIAGIDFICPDITEAVREVGGAICEVNAAPGFRMHTHPTVGEPQYVAKPVLDLLFPPGAPSRIPVIAVTGTNGKTTTSRMIAHIFKGIGHKVGMTSTDGIVIDERLVIKADASGPKSARMVLQNPRVDLAVFEVARGGLLREGLGYERNDVAVVTNISADHLGMGGIETVEQLADVKQVVVEAVPRTGTAVLNADDPLVAKMARACSGTVLWFSLQKPGEPGRDLVEQHRAGGGRAVVLDDGELGPQIMLCTGRRAMPLAYAAALPATLGGAAMMMAANAMAAAGAAWAAGAHLHDIRAGLRTFTTTYDNAPGRLNVAEVDGLKVVVDYCHNAGGMRALGDVVERLAAQTPSGDVRHRRIGVIATAGDRRDSDLFELGEVSAQYFDEIVVREDVRLRGRPAGDSAAHMVAGVRAGMANGGRCRAVDTVLDELDATREALQRAIPGDLVVVCADRVADVWALVEQHRRHRST